MMRSLLVRGMLVGLAAGCLGFVFAHTFGEPQVRNAIAYEDRQYTSQGKPPEPEIVSRGMQSTAGLGAGVVVYGAAFGGLFAVAFAFANGRFGHVGPRAMSGLLALCGFAAVYFVPTLKYPANPPAIGDPATIGHRTLLYVVMIALSVVAAVFAARLGRQLLDRLGAWNATLVAAAGYLGIMLVGGLVLPAVNEVPKDFPPSVLWWFRVSSIGTQVVMWTTVGLLFGALTERSWNPARHAAQAEPAPVG